MRYFLELSYLGTGYAGFQVQENAHTIQAEVEQALQTLLREKIALTGSSRTDAGVHARQNYFHFDLERLLSDKIVYNLNALLPASIAVSRLIPVTPEAHCRFDATARRYRYVLCRRKDPFWQGRAWMYPYKLDEAALQHCASLLPHYTDFTSFSKRNTQVKTKLCRIELSRWFRQSDDIWIYEVQANRFLRGMVRGLVGTMLQAGRGRLTVDEFAQVIEARDCTRADFSAPPQGLYLEEVVFPEAVLRSGST